MSQMLKAFELLRLMDREIPGQLVSAFLYIASHNPCHKQAMEEDLDFTTSSASRLTDWLSEYHRLGKPGLGLIVKTKDPTDFRRILIKLTPKGESLARQMKEHLYGD
jgi:DNA-binding MarR family transcriptional regulator